MQAFIYMYMLSLSLALSFSFQILQIYVKHVRNSLYKLLIIIIITFMVIETCTARHILPTKATFISSLDLVCDIHIHFYRFHCTCTMYLLHILPPLSPSSLHPFSCRFSLSFYFFPAYFLSPFPSLYSLSFPLLPFLYLFMSPSFSSSFLTLSHYLFLTNKMCFIGSVKIERLDEKHLVALCYMKESH